MRRWRLRDNGGAAIAHCWQYGEIASPFGGPKMIVIAGKPLCGVPFGGEWRDWQPGDSWCIGFCRRCAKQQQPPQAGQSGTTR